jgi:hypothetical protein
MIIFKVQRHTFAIYLVTPVGAIIARVIGWCWRRGCCASLDAAYLPVLHLTLSNAKSVFINILMGTGANVLTSFGWLIRVIVYESMLWIIARHLFDHLGWLLRFLLADSLMRTIAFLWHFLPKFATAFLPFVSLAIWIISAKLATT